MAKMKIEIENLRQKAETQEKSASKIISSQIEEYNKIRKEFSDFRDKTEAMLQVQDVKHSRTRKMLTGNNYWTIFYVIIVFYFWGCILFILYIRALLFYIYLYIHTHIYIYIYIYIYNRQYHCEFFNANSSVFYIGRG